MGQWRRGKRREGSLSARAAWRGPEGLGEDTPKSRNWTGGEEQPRSQAVLRAVLVTSGAELLCAPAPACGTSSAAGTTGPLRDNGTGSSRRRQDVRRRTWSPSWRVSRGWADGQVPRRAARWLPEAALPNHHKLGGFETTDLYSLTLLEARSPK